MEHLTSTAYSIIAVLALAATVVIGFAFCIVSNTANVVLGFAVIIFAYFFSWAADHYLSLRRHANA